MISNSKRIDVLILEDERAQAKRLRTIVDDAASSFGIVPNVECIPSADDARKLLANDWIPYLAVIDHALDGEHNGLTFFADLIKAGGISYVLILSSWLMRPDANGHEIWEAYRSLISRAETMGMKVRLIEKDSRETARAWIMDAVSRFGKTIAKGRTILTRSLNDIIARSPAMRQVVVTINNYLEDWQSGGRNLLIITGERGVGKRFLARRVAEAARVDRADSKFDFEEGEWLRPTAFPTAMRYLYPKQLSGGLEGFYFKYSETGPQYTWSQIIPDMGNWSMRLNCARLAVIKVAEHPRHPIIWIFETAWWNEFRSELESSLQNVMTVVNVPNLLERELDIILLAEHFCTKLGEGSFELDQTAKSALRSKPPSSAVELRTMITSAIKRRPPDAKHISAGDLPWIVTTVTPIQQRPSKPGEISSECEARIIQFLKKQKAIAEGKSKEKPLTFGKAFEKHFDTLDKKIIRAVAWASASKEWEGRGVHVNEYKTLYIKKGGDNLEWAGVCKGTSRDEITNWVTQYPKYFFWLAVEYGPKQPSALK